MTVDDIRIKTDFFEHWKTIALEESLGEIAPWCLVRAWRQTAKHRPLGDLSGIPDSVIERWAGWKGERGAFIAELVRVRFIDGEEGQRSMHDWAEHQPWVVGAPDRSEAAKTAAEARWDEVRRKQEAERLRREGASQGRGKRKASGPDAGRMQDASAEHATSNAPSPSPSPFPSPPSEESGAARGQPSLELVNPEPPPSKATPERVFALYLEVLPSAGWIAHRQLAPKQEKNIAKRIAADGERRELSWWRGVFEHARTRITWPHTKTLGFFVDSEDELLAIVDGVKDDRDLAPARPASRPAARSMAQQIMARAEELEREAAKELEDGPGRTLVYEPERGAYAGRARASPATLPLWSSPVNRKEDLS